ncbi:hypothetical protein Hanom_Chr09g00843321 [Helianthus anomalus]
MFSKSIKIPKEKPLSSCIPMYHYKRGRVLVTFECNRVNISRLITSRPKPPDFRPGRSSTNINTLLSIWSPNIQSKTILINKFTPTINMLYKSIKPNNPISNLNNIICPPMNIKKTIN